MLRSGLIPNLNPPGISGLISGLNPAELVALLANFDYRAAVTAFDFSSEFATDQWAMQDAVNMANTGTVGTETLANTNGYMQQEAIGLHNGTDYVSRKAWESTSVAANNSYLIASGTTAGDSAGVDFCFRVVCRFKAAQVASDYVISKVNATVQGWNVISRNGGGFEFRLRSSSTTVAIVRDAAGLDDGSWHWVSGWYDASANLYYLKTDLTAETSGDSSTIGTMTNANALMVNKYQASTAFGNPGMQVAYAGVCVGANSEAMYDATEVDCILPGTDPGAADAAKTALTTISRASLISHLVASGKVCHFGAGVTPATCQLPITFNEFLEEGAGGLGLFCNSAKVNLVPNSRTSGSTTGATTNTDNAVDAADGFRAAATHLATASPDFVGKTEVVVHETAYTGSVFLKEVTVGCVGRVYAYDLTNSAEIAGAVAFTADDTWEQRIQVPFTTPTNCVSVSFRVEITNDTETIATDFWQVELGDTAGAIVNTAGGSSALVASVYKGAGNYIQYTAGEIRVSFVPAKIASLGWVMSTPGIEERKVLLNGNKVHVVVENGAGGAEYNKVHTGAHSPNDYMAVRLLWDESGVEGFRAVSFDGVDREDSAVSPWTGPAGPGFAASVHIGMDIGSGFQLDGWIEQLECFSGAEV